MLNKKRQSQLSLLDNEVQWEKKKIKIEKLFFFIARKRVSHKSQCFEANCAKTERKRGKKISHYFEFIEAQIQLPIN